MPRKVGYVILNVDGRHFQVNRYLLTSQSIYFRELFRNPTKRDKYGAIIIPGNADRFGLLLDYLTGEYHLAKDQVESIINDGVSLYLIPSLVYLSQMKAEYEAKDKQRIEQIKQTMNKMTNLNKEISNLETYIDRMRSNRDY